MLPFINYDSPKEIRTFLEKNGLGMRKKFGQNFLINPAARLKLFDALELKAKDEVWEIGPGLGVMTAGLLEREAQVTAFEIDPAFVRILREVFAREIFAHEHFAKPAFRLVEGDVLKTWPSVETEKELLLLGNLPYNIAAALLADFIEKGRFFRRMVVTVQREVAQRMAARPGSKDYSSFSVLCSSVYKVSLLSIIKSSSFYPAPRVDSQGVRLDLLPVMKAKSKLFHPLVRCLFSGRRKMIKNTLLSFASSVIITGENKREVVEEALKHTGISGERRPETLGIDEYAALASFFEGCSHE